MKMQNAELRFSSLHDSDRSRNLKTSKPLQIGIRCALLVAAALVLWILIWQGVTAKGAPDPILPHTSKTVAVLDIGVLVFREGLECILVLSAITASMVGDRRVHRVRRAALRARPDRAGPGQAERAGRRAAAGRGRRRRAGGHRAAGRRREREGDAAPPPDSLRHPEDAP